MVLASQHAARSTKVVLVASTVFPVLLDLQNAGGVAVDPLSLWALSTKDSEATVLAADRALESLRVVYSFLRYAGSHRPTDNVEWLFLLVGYLDGAFEDAVANLARLRFLLVSSLQNHDVTAALVAVLGLSFDEGGLLVALAVSH